MLLLLQQIEKIEDITKKSLLVDKTRTVPQIFMIDLKIAHFLAQLINNTFYQRSNYVTPQGIYSDIQVAKQFPAGGGYIAHRVGQHKEGNGIIEKYILSPVLSLNTYYPT